MPSKGLNKYTVEPHTGKENCSKVQQILQLDEHSALQLNCNNSGNFYVQNPVSRKHTINIKELTHEPY